MPAIIDLLQQQFQISKFWKIWKDLICFLIVRKYLLLWDYLYAKFELHYASVTKQLNDIAQCRDKRSKQLSYTHQLSIKI